MRIHIISFWFIITIMTLASLAGRWIGGTTADYWDKRKVLVVAFVMQFIGLIVFVNIRILKALILKIILIVIAIYQQIGIAIGFLGN